MSTYGRLFEPILREKLARPFVHVLFGGRQTGKSTLVRGLLPKGALIIDFSDPKERWRFSENVGLFVDICNALPAGRESEWVFVDEAQTVPSVFDSIQSLYDRDKTRFRFVLCGSSARRLRSQSANLLPGRSMRYLLHPLVSREYEPAERAQGFSAKASPFSWENTLSQPPRFPRRSLEDRLVFGDLPGVAVLNSEADKADLLETYAAAYLEEEIRRETIVREWGAFLRFLRFAASDAGGIVNFSSISRETGISSPTVKSYYQLLEDMFVGFSVPAYSGSPRKSALSSPRFFFFDNGVRNAALGLPLAEGLVRSEPGRLFEHWAGCQLWRNLSYSKGGRLEYYRTSDGAEVDFIVREGENIIPIEVKWTENPSRKDARHLKAFMADQPERCGRGFIVSRCPYVLDLGDSVTAIPWWYL